LIGLLLLLWLRRRPFMRAGELFFSYLIWYSVGRFFIEALRTDSLAFTAPAWLVSFIDALWSPMTLLFEPGAMEYGNVRISQLLAILIVVASIVLIVLRRKKGWSSERYSDPIRSSKTPAAASEAGEGI
jgi:phosphatidylglycerol:prolipoprotein diacylglycerol transferase